MAETPNIRHMRHRNYDRQRRSKKLHSFLEERETTFQPVVDGLDFTADATSNDLTTGTTAHGYAVGDGPFILTTTGTLPGGLAVDTQYWVVTVPTTTTLEVSTSKGGTPVDILDAGTGTHTIREDINKKDVFEKLKEPNNAEIVAGATDYDTI